MKFEAAESADGKRYFTLSDPDEGKSAQRDAAVPPPTDADAPTEGGSW